MGKIYTDHDGNKIERLSRWIKIHTLPVTKRHHLYDYATDGSGYHPYQDKFDPSTGVLLDYFVFQGKQYPIDQFLPTTSTWAIAWNPYYSENDVDDYIILSGYESEEYFNPLLIEIGGYGEFVRVYKEVRS